MNYLEHPEQIKFMDGILAHSQEWQWMIDLVEERYEIPTINSWNEFCKTRSIAGDIFDYYIKILNICDKEWFFSKKEFKEIWEITKFYIGISTAESCAKKIYNNYCRLFFFCIWITKLENVDNNFDYLFDISLLKTNNYFELIKCDSLVTIESELLAYLNQISVSGLDKPIQCLEDNLHYKKYGCDKSFLANNRKDILAYNAFSFKMLDKQNCKTWQETYLLDMLGISFKDRKIEPILVIEGKATPDPSLWSKKVLYAIQDFFKDEAADFVVETILYIKYNCTPSKKIKLLHCKLLYEAIEQGEDNSKIFSSSSYLVLSYLFKDRLMSDCRNEEIYINFLKSIHKYVDPILIMDIKEAGIPISQEQNKELDDYLINRYKTIDNVSTIQELINYFEDDTTTKEIDTQYLKIADEKFSHYSRLNTGIEVGVLYYDYMIFLFNVNKNSQNSDKRYIQKLMLALQKDWQENAFKKQSENMHRFEYEQKIDSEKITNFNDLALLNPIVFAGYCMPVKEEGIMNIMSIASESPLIHLCRRMIFSPIYPKENREVTFERHDIDKLLLDYVTNLINTKGYKLLNKFKPEEFVKSIHENYKTNTQGLMAMIVKEKELYDLVRESSPIELMQYSENKSLAIVTQLFPVLEIKIRELVSKFGIFHVIYLFFSALL